MNIYEAFETDAATLKDGRWLDIVFQGKTVCEVRIRSASPDLNAELRKAMTDEAVGLLENADKQLTIHAALADSDLERKLFAQAVITDWKGVGNKAGKPLKCTPKNALTVFKDLPLLFQQVKVAAYRWETFRAAVQDGVMGNSRTSSDTK